jgi:hypothetical protein
MKNKEFRFDDPHEGMVLGLRWNKELMISEYCWIENPFKNINNNVIDINELRQRHKRPPLGENFAGDFFGMVVPFRNKKD